MEEKKNLLTYAGLKALEDELQKAKGLKVNGKTYNHSAAKALNINL